MYNVCKNVGLELLWWCFIVNLFFVSFFKYGVGFDFGVVVVFFVVGGVVDV